MKISWKCTNFSEYLLLQFPIGGMRNPVKGSEAPKGKGRWPKAKWNCCCCPKRDNTTLDHYTVLLCKYRWINVACVPCEISNPYHMIFKYKAFHVIHTRRGQRFNRKKDFCTELETVWGIRTTYLLMRTDQQRKHEVELRVVLVTTQAKNFKPVFNCYLCFNLCISQNTV